jgi:ATP-dependent helicase/nuclease subunit B
MQRAGLTSFDPDGRPRRNEPLYRILTLCAELAREPLFATVAALVRCPDVLAWLRSDAGVDFSSARVLRDFDRLHADHLPTTLDAAGQHASGTTAQALEAFKRLRAELTGHAFPENVRRALALVFGPRAFDLAHVDDARAVALAGDWNETAARVAEAATRFPGPAPIDLFDLARESFGDGVRFDEKPAGALDLQGWLELLWEDAPHVAVAGLNDGHVPEAIVGDPFLPEALRERLGLKNNSTRLARDTYILAASPTRRGDAPFSSPLPPRMRARSLASR